MIFPSANFPSSLVASFRGTWRGLLASLAAFSWGCGEPDFTSRLGEVAVFGTVVAEETIIPSSGDGYDLFRASHLGVLSDGRIAILNSGSQEVLIFSASGALLNRFGRSGEGPGEFGRPLFLSILPGDSILVTELDVPQRATVFSSTGSVERTFTFQTPDVGSFYVGPAGLVGNLLIAVQAQEPVIPSSVAGMHYIPVRLFIYDLEGALLGRFQVEDIGNEYFLFDVAGQLRSTRPVLMRRAFVAAGPSGTIAAASDSREVAVVATDGSIRSRLRIGGRAPEPASIPVDSLRAAWAASAPDDASRLLRARLVSEIPYPKATPRIADLKVDATGRRWISTAKIDGQPDGQWLVYTGDAPLGSIRIPADLRVLAITANEVVGIRTSDLGEESVVRVTFVLGATPPV